MLSRLYLIRHGETAWSLSGQHTGRTDLPLTSHGEEAARRLANPLREVAFSTVLTSPRQRARRTAELAGFGAAALTDADLAEWDYGELEGLRTAEILLRHPGWSIFRDGCPGGESVADLVVRTDRLLLRLRQLEGNVLVFSHGHLGRVLAARWLGLPLEAARYFELQPATISILSHEHQDPAAPVILQWNAPA